MSGARKGRWAGCSDAGATEYLAGVVAGQAGVLERARARTIGAVTEQPVVVGVRVNVDRPLAVAVLADDASAVEKRDREVRPVPSDLSRRAPTVALNRFHAPQPTPTSHPRPVPPLPTPCLMALTR